MKTFKEISEASGVSSSGAQHMLSNDAEKKAHSALMQKKHGVKTTYHGSDELKYHGSQKNVKKALGTHYGGDHDHAKDDHPHIYKENVKTADRKPEIYTKPDGKKGTRMVPVDREVIKQEKTLEWLKASLAREAKKVKPRQDDMEEAYENTMYCKKCGCERGNPDPDCSCKMENASLTDAQCYSEQSKCGSLRKEDVNELTIADVQKATAMAKKRQDKEREAGKKSVSTTDLGARMPKKETFEPHMMYDPKTGKAYKADKEADHLRMKKMGYTHDKPKNEAHDPKHVKQAVGIASDPRYKGGNMTGATKVIDKLSKGLSDHPQVKAVLKRQNEGVKSFAEISKGMAGRYIKKAQVSTADAAKSTERGYTDSRSGDRDISKAGKDQAKKGIKTFINRNKGTSTAVNKLTGKAKVPAREGMAQDIAKDKIDREKDMDAKRHDRMMDKARTKDTKTKNMSELSNNKMGQYVRKAGADIAKKAGAGDTDKAKARVKGVSKAMDKMDKNRLFGRQG